MSKTQFNIIGGDDDTPFAEDGDLIERNYLELPYGEGLE